MLTTNLDFSGLLKISDDLKALSKAENRRVLNKATRAGANIVRDEAKKRAPKKTGKLKKNIVTLSHRSKGNNDASSGVHIRGRNPRTGNSDTKMKADNPNNSFYWRFLEHGTSKMAARPFIRPAFEARQQQIEKAVVEVANQAIDEVLKK